MLLLGPLPDAVRVFLRRLVAEARPAQPHEDERLNGFMLSGGPGGLSYIDVDGEVWNMFLDFDGSGETIEHVPDGPMKVGLVAIAAERVPELASWLPRRPHGATDCVMCGATGWWLPPLPRLLCPECHGMGWK